MAVKKRRVTRLAGHGRFGSKGALKSAISGGSGGQHPALKIIRAEEPLTVRFLEEPEDWFGYQEHYDESKGSFIPCTGEDCCEDLGKPSQAVLANAYVVDENKVMVIKMKFSLVDVMVNQFYEKYSTVKDRDYELRRVGTGMRDTKYFATPEDPSRMNTSRFKLLDPEEVLLYGMQDSEEEDEKPRRTSRREEEDDYEDDEYDENADDDEDEPPRRTARKSTTRKVAAKKTTRSVNRRR